jgi:tetratricopeptide (TPR) repeat protein
MYIISFLGGVLRRISIVLIFCLAVVPAAADEPLKLLVFPLNSSSEDGGAWIGEGMALSLSTQLNDGKIRPFFRGEIEDLLVENGLPADMPLSRGSMIYVAEQADADFVVMGNYVENEDSLKISTRMLDMRTMKQGGEFTVSGTLAALPAMENELAWMVYSSVVRPPAVSRETFHERMRRIPNSAYAGYIEALNTFDENRQLQLLESAVREYADFAEARFKIGRLYYQKRDYARALPHIEFGLKLPNERLKSEFMIGTSRLQLGENARAIEDYTRFLSQTRHTAALNNLAVAYVRSGDNVQAMRTLTDAWAQDRDDSAVAINLVIARYLAGNAPAAMEFVEEAINVYPGNGMLHFLSSFLMEEAGNEERAAADLARAARFGVDVDRLSSEKPQSWMRVILNWTMDQ